MHEGSKLGIKDRGGRRAGFERRKSPLLEYTPDRRTGQDRRNVRDRRNGNFPGEIVLQRRSTDRFLEFASTQKGFLMAILMSLPLWGLILYLILTRISAF